MCKNNISASEGGGVWYNDAGHGIINCTIVNNQAVDGEGLACRKRSTALVINTILWGNVASGSRDQVYLDSTACDPQFKCCAILGGRDGFEGPGSGDEYQEICIRLRDEDPLFADSVNGLFNLLFF